MKNRIDLGRQVTGEGFFLNVEANDIEPGAKVF